MLVRFFAVLFKWTLSVGFIISKPRGKSLDFRIASEEFLYCQPGGRCRRVLRLRLLITRIRSLVFRPKILTLLFSGILFSLLLVVLFPETLALVAVIVPEFFLYVCFRILVGPTRFILLPR